MMTACFLLLLENKILDHEEWKQLSSLHILLLLQSELCVYKRTNGSRRSLIEPREAIIPRLLLSQSFTESLSLI